MLGPGQQPFSHVDAVRVARTIIGGLQYLHAQLICPRDLKPENILFHGDGSLKIIDFGLSREVAERGMTANVGSLLWAAPETMDLTRVPSKYSTSIDVFAFGIILWQMWTRLEPYSHVLHIWDIREGMGAFCQLSPMMYSCETCDGSTTIFDFLNLFIVVESKTNTHTHSHTLSLLLSIFPGL